MMTSSTTPAMTNLRVLVAMMGVHVSAMAQAIWTPMVGPGPAARCFHAMTYDTLRSRVVMFGGQNASGTVFSDTWERSGFVWSQVASAGPSQRLGHGMVYDNVRGRTVLFGGQQNGGGAMSDTWEWDGGAWTLVATTGPGARAFHSMVFDSLRGKTVLFGGGIVPSTSGDTWEWNGATWSQVVTTGPAPRLWHAMSYDSVRGKTVLFGGTTGFVGGEFGDTWEWNGSTWSLRATSGPAPARLLHALAYDQLRQRTVLFGGESGSGPTYTAHTDTWEWNGSSWIQVTAVGPGERRAHAMAFDSQRWRTVLFGGLVIGGSAVIGDTWEWGNVLSPPTATVFGSGCGSPALALLPDAAGLPFIGMSARAFLTNVPSPFAFIAVGWSNTQAGPFLLPVPLDGYGMTGCFMRQSSEAIGEPTTSTGPGTASYSLSVPFLSSLLGLRIYLQGWAVAPGMNPAGIIVSNGLDWQVGY